MSVAIDRAALAAAVGVAHDGRNAVEERGAVLLADNDVGYSRDVAGIACVDASFMLTHMTQIAAAIDVAHHAALDVDVGGCHEVVVRVRVFGKVELVHHGTSLAAAIDVFVHGAALQLDVGGAGDDGMLSVAAAVGIAGHVAALVDVDVGIVVILGVLQLAVLHLPEIVVVLAILVFRIGNGFGQHDVLVLNVVPEALEIAAVCGYFARHSLFRGAAGFLELKSEPLLQ